ncbi:hypothetical protein FTUN_3146 [Frigoriglobus tundricola]|uniref:Uncharacterized protein n=1 Tax=Frigoriglobus tundricola TaxID=2774151 RepID=A0A6M5YQF6_9BACT|nr:hypothetical protein FTUN_3146 [Frigoriglobus tundricola]
MIKMPLVNMSGAATLAAAEGLAALGVGDTVRARQKYAEAGAILEAEMKVRHGGGEKQLLRFLAATQYYKGGDYQKAQDLAHKIDARVLPKNVRGLLPQFLKDVKLRTSPGYVAGIRQTLLKLWQQKQPAESLAVLQEHPYVLPPVSLAFVRAALCGELANFRAAALFFANAIRQAPDDVGLVLTTAAQPLLLRSQDRLAEAWEYAQCQVELVPHPVTFVTASIICYHRACTAHAEDRKTHFAEQLAFVEKAWDVYQKLDLMQQNHPDMRAYVAFGLELAGTMGLRQGNKQRGKEVWEQAVKLGANASHPWKQRASVADPSEEVSQAVEAWNLSERETHFFTRFTPEPSIRQQLEVVGA